MKQYENLEHTADLKIRSFGNTKEEAFANMAKGMFANIVDEENLLHDQPVELEIKIESPDFMSLLVDYLSQLLYLSDTNNEVYFYFDLAIWQKPSDLVDRPGKWLLEGVAKGFKVSGLKTEIKAVTYNDLKIEEAKEGGWLAEVVFDI
ncbi:MAG TPA: archease [Candidatus Uhrbacteria bacterium]|nr:archease [Candidatus Uhrbacteria bacterium]